MNVIDDKVKEKHGQLWTEIQFNAKALRKRKGAQREHKEKNYNRILG